MPLLCYLLGRIHITHRKFRFGYSFSITTCDIRNWGHYMRKGSNWMRLMPNSMISVKAKKKRIRPWKKGSELRRTGCRRAHTDASPAPAPLTIQVLQSDHLEVKQGGILPLFSFAHLLLHLPLQNALLPQASVNIKSLPCQPYPSPDLAIPSRIQPQHLPNSPMPGAAP